MTERRFDVLSGEWRTYATDRQSRTFLPAAGECPLCPPDRAEPRREVIGGATTGLVGRDGPVPRGPCARGGAGRGLEPRARPHPRRAAGRPPAPAARGVGGPLRGARRSPGDRLRPHLREQ